MSSELKNTHVHNEYETRPKMIYAN